jgi:methyl-accepting chemotaxis protein
MPEAGPKADVRELIRDFESAMHATTSQVRLDLERARTVVRDATVRLDRNLRALHQATTAHQGALEDVTRAFSATEGAGGGAGFAASSEALLRQFVEEIVRVSRDSMRMIEQLSDLSGHVEGITGCADAIDGLARETRFIAFNARIETHRAGDAGRTFKVVADEVKRLANASSNLSNQIRQGVSACKTELQNTRKTATGLASHDMSRAIDSQRALSDAVTKLDTVNKDLESMLDVIGTNVAEAVRALQFEEMIAQIMAATIQRVEGLGELSVRALQVIERGHNGDRAAPLAEIIKSLRLLSERVAVQPQPLMPGSLEQL